MKDNANQTKSLQSLHKEKARLDLLNLPPEEAQRRVNQVLYSQYWKVLNMAEWEESIEPEDEENHS